MPNSIMLFTAFIVTLLFSVKFITIGCPGICSKLIDLMFPVIKPAGNIFFVRILYVSTNFSFGFYISTDYKSALFGGRQKKNTSCKSRDF